MLRFGFRKLLLAFVVMSLLLSVAFVKIEHELKMTSTGFIEKGDIVDVFEFPPEHAYTKYGGTLTRICRDVRVRSVTKVDANDYRILIMVSIFQSVAINRSNKKLTLHENYSDGNELQVYL